MLSGLGQICEICMHPEKNFEIKLYEMLFLAFLKTEIYGFLSKLQSTWIIVKNWWSSWLPYNNKTKQGKGQEHIIVK